MSVLRQDPTAYGQLSVRSILELRQQCLREFHFVDPYREVKRSENEAALQLLPERLARADALELAARARDVIEGVLAGNSFDWGASATAERMEQADLDFENEKRKLRNRPWLVDDLAAVVSRLTTRCSDGAPAYKLALIFVDNAGADIVLGVIPFARFLLQAGTRVVLAANTWPVLNDVTADELR